MFKVCIDPGHNEIGADIGARCKVLVEEVLTLKIAKLVKKGLEAQGKFSVIMTREGQTVNGPASTLLDSLRTRCKIANDANADLFVSIHINAGGGTGSEVLIYGKGGKAEECAKIMAPLIAEAGDWPNRGVKIQNVHVIRETKMPAILTENGFIDHDQDNKKLQRDFYLSLIADAHVLGICSYFGIQYKSTQEVATDTNTLLPPLILYSGNAEERIVPYLQEKIKTPALRLGLATKQLINGFGRIYGVGGLEDDYEVEGQKIPLYKHISGSGRIQTADAVIRFIKDIKEGVI